MEDCLCDVSVGDMFSVFWNAVSRSVHQNAVKHGFWDRGVHDDEVEKLMLMSSEIYEAFEAIRSGDSRKKSEKIPAFTKMEEELADAVIRIMDFAEAKGLRLPNAILSKHEFNKSRPYLHGKKF